MRISYRVIAAVLAVLMSVMLAPAANACSRVTWLGPDGAVITGRSMDWPYSFHSHLYAYPRGLEQNGAGGIKSLTWTTKFGAIVVAGTTDPEGPIDGIFGPKTKRAVRLFQGHWNDTHKDDPIAVDGIPGPITRKRIQQALEAR